MSIANALGMTDEQFIKIVEGRKMRKEDNNTETTCVDYLMNFPPYMRNDVADDYFREQGNVYKMPERVLYNQRENKK